MTLLELSQLASVFSALGTFAIGAGTLVILFLSLRLNHKTTQANILSEFNSRFSRVMEMRANPEIIKNPQIYFDRFWSLQYDQFTQWCNGFVDDDSFDYWMRNRYAEWQQDKKLGDMTHKEGFDYAAESLRDTLFKKFMTSLHEEGPGMLERNRRRLKRLGSRKAKRHFHP